MGDWIRIPPNPKPKLNTMFTISYAKALDLILHNPVKVDDSLLIFTAITDDDELYYNEDGAIITFPKKLNEEVKVRDGRIILKGMDKEDYLFEILQTTKVTPEFVNSKESWK